VKVGRCMLVLLEAVASGGLPEPLELEDPVAAFRTLSHDPELRATVATTDGRRWTALDLQEATLDGAPRALPDAAASGDGPLRSLGWGAIEAARTGPPALGGLAPTGRRSSTSSRPTGAPWAPGPAHDRVRMLDLQYHDVRRDKGLHHRLVAAGRVVRLTTDDRGHRGDDRRRPRTRGRGSAGECVRRFPGAVVAAGWDSVVLDLGADRGLVRLPMPEPGLGTRALTEAALDAADDVADLLRTSTCARSSPASSPEAGGALPSPDGSAVPVARGPRRTDERLGDRCRVGARSAAGAGRRRRVRRDAAAPARSAAARRRRRTCSTRSTPSSRTTPRSSSAATSRRAASDLPPSARRRVAAEVRRRVIGLETEYGISCTLDGRRSVPAPRTSPDACSVT
jgi:hypothetical protein